MIYNTRNEPQLVCESEDSGRSCAASILLRVLGAILAAAFIATANEREGNVNNSATLTRSNESFTSCSLPVSDQFNGNQYNLNGQPHF